MSGVTPVASSGAFCHPNGAPGALRKLLQPSCLCSLVLTPKSQEAVGVAQAGVTHLTQGALGPWA